MALPRARRCPRNGMPGCITWWTRRRKPARAIPGRRRMSPTSLPCRPAIGSGGGRNGGGFRDRRRRDPLMRGNVIEAVMGAVVLVVAAVFLFFAYNTSQVRAVSGYEVWANF